MNTVPVLLALRGLPASGKSTFARKWVAEDPQHRFRINRDDLRAMGHDSLHVDALPGMEAETGTERQIVLFRNAGMVALLQAGISVVVDETNLTDGKIRHLMVVADAAGARFEMRAFSTSWQECLARNEARTGVARVPDEAMHGMRAVVGDRDLTVLPDLTV